ncbi:WxL domain-containing protein [Enterococcus sp. BWM-S5]|uniref:WxL domain-containing protein n=1 Tax=Enterococcus larvae TaxID=2794352 RepID=A0ABS4CK84_9ENTE|nr:WxL domain-containing protein [Enterococcus larvae]MBP1046526.1 WxL domain-containing protein [Enterococcus larvae]
MKRSLIYIMVFLCTGSAACFLAEQVEATDDDVAGSGHITFTGDYSDVGVRDPENPSTEVDAGNSPSTQGKLRIDFVPQFQFTSVNKISDKDMTYSVNAQLFNDETEARGNFIQISDYRGAMLGWTLQLRQEMQFQNAQTANSQLDGAVLSLDYSWTNSTQDAALSPTISKEVIHLDNIGATYNLAEASPGTGAGTWSISFGGSADNPAGIAETLTPKVDQNGHAMLDAAYGNKQMHENSAITLSVPGGTKKDPVSYSTVLTWILAELP